MQANRFSSIWSIKLTFIIIAVASLSLSFLPTVKGSSQTATPEQTEFFEKKIRPLLAAKCQKCHSADTQVAGLDISTADGFTRGGESGNLINREKPEESRLLKVISYDENPKMPPTGKLKSDEIEALTTWVKMGAPWPGTTTAAAPAKSWPKNSSVRSFTDDEKNWWAFQSMRDYAPPQVKDSKWVKTPIDNFVLAKLEEKGLKPAPSADKLTLLRRATFDLTGLPPTIKEMNDFVADQSPDAFRKVVERLLS